MTGRITRYPLPASAIPADPKVKIGTLSNGLRYYIRQNPKPEKRAELRLVVNAGSILENDNQLGYAHFVEHTAFNGTTHFAKNDLVKYLQSIGVRFGADLNAYTSFDETVYILPVPTDTARIVEQAFTILEDWAHGQTFDSTEVMNERGVVREEWRGRRAPATACSSSGCRSRSRARATPSACRSARSRASCRPRRRSCAPSITTGIAPTCMAVIAVGDFDPADIEAQIKKHFGGIPAKPNAQKRPIYDVPGNTEPLIAIATDKEATSSDVDLIFKLPVKRRRRSATTGATSSPSCTCRCSTPASPRSRRSRTRRSSAPARRRAASFARTTDAFTLGANVKDGGIERGLEALLTEARRVDQFGFLQSELDRAKQNLLRGYERAYAERDKTPSASFVQEYIGNYLRRRGDSGHRVRVQARAAAAADDHARRRQQAGEQLDHRREPRHHRASRRRRTA